MLKKIKNTLAALTLLNFLEINLEEGKIAGKVGLRHIFVPITMLTTMREILEKELGIEKAGEVLYETGVEYGRQFALKIQRTFKIEDASKLLRLCLKFAHLGGWGRHAINIDEERAKVTIIVYNSPTSEVKADHCVCSYQAGLYAGAASVIFGKEMYCKEVSCRAKGDSFCKFIIS